MLGLETRETTVVKAELTFLQTRFEITEEAKAAPFSSLR
jgi:hypothetical protein